MREGHSHQQHPRLTPGAARSEATDPAKGAPAGFVARLSEGSGDERPGGAPPRWSTFWELTWEAVPGAVGYLLYLSTMEGTSAVPRLVEEPRWRIEVARGGTGSEPDAAQLESQLALAASQLKVFVAACFVDGASEPRGPFPVGERLG